MSPMIDCYRRWFIADQSFSPIEAEFLIAAHLKNMRERQLLVDSFSAAQLNHVQALKNHLIPLFSSLMLPVNDLLVIDRDYEYLNQLNQLVARMERAYSLTKAAKPVYSTAEREYYLAKLWTYLNRFFDCMMNSILTFRRACCQ